MPRLLQGKLNYSSISPFYASEIPGLFLCYVNFQNKLQLATSYN